MSQENTEENTCLLVFFFFLLDRWKSSKSTINGSFPQAEEPSVVELIRETHQLF